MQVDGHGGARRGSGRKPLPADQRRSKTVAIALTEDEYAQLKKLASGRTLAIYTRDVILRHLRRKR